MTTLTKKTLGISLLCGLLMVGCNKQENEPKAENKEKVKETTTVNTTPNCDDAGVKNSLVKALSFATNEEVTALMTNYNNADKLDLARRTQQRLGQISLDLQNIQADGDTCLADMVVVVPSGDLEHASAYYKANNKPSIAELAVKHALKINEGRISSAIRYTIKDGQATLSDTPNALAFIADLMSASAYRMAQGEGRVNTTARPAIKVQPAKPTEVARPQPVVREPNLDAQERSEPPTTDNNNSTNNSNETASNTVNGDLTHREPTAQREQSIAKKEPTKEPKPTPAENNGEIAIVETDETY